MKKCPLAMSNSYMTVCQESNCAWWNSEKHECAVNSIAKFLSLLEEQVSIMNLRRDSYEADVIQV